MDHHAVDEYLRRDAENYQRTHPQARPVGTEEDIAALESNDQWLPLDVLYAIKEAERRQAHKPPRKPR